MRKDKVYRYNEFLNENLHETPEDYVDMALQKIKTKVEKMFAHAEVDNGQIKKYGDSVDKNKKDEGSMSFKDLNLNLDSCELSKYSKSYDNVKFVFSDEEYRYDVVIIIDLKEAVPEDMDKDFSDTEIKKCYIKYKKYDINAGMKLIGTISKTVKVDDINEDLLINLKLEIDEEYGGDDEEFEIET